MSKKLLFLCGLILLGLIGNLALAAGGYSVPWFTVDGGGGTSTGGDYEISGSVGQPDAGDASGGSYTLNGGFWAAIPPLTEPPPALDHYLYLPLVLK